MRRAGRIITAFFVLVAFACGFIGVTAGLDVTQPTARGSDVVVEFEVRQGEGTASVAARLEKIGLIRNAQLFRQLAKYRRLDTHIEPGVYKLSPGMTMDVIIRTLLVGKPDQQVVTIPPGLRVAQFPAYLAPKLPNFKADVFLNIATTGVLPDGTKLADAYWYVPPKGQDVAVALEGYLFPDTYYFNTDDDAVKVVKRLLDGLGEHLCPGPDDVHAAVYIRDHAQCKAHATMLKVGDKSVDVFTEMDHHFFTTDDRQALHDTLTLGSIVEREVRSASNIVGVAGVLYNRYLAWKNNRNNPAGDVVDFLNADPTAMYARDTAHPPGPNAKWWDALADAAGKIEPDNAYNTANPTHKGLPPGPIAGLQWADIAAVATADEPTPSPYYYYITGKDHLMHYAQSYAEHLQNIQRYGTDNG